MSAPVIAIIGIGELVLIQFRDASDTLRTIEPIAAEKWWLAWKGDRLRGTLMVVRAASPITVDGAGPVVRGHVRFHGESPNGWRDAVWSPPVSPVQRLGFATGVRYRIPPNMPSNKAGDDYHHAFGDFGNGDDRSDDATYRPALHQDARGCLYFHRRSGNVYHLDDWMRA